MCKLKKYTVIAVCRDSGQIISRHVSALTSSESFTVVSRISDLDHVASLNGWIMEGEGVEFPGSATVCSDTVLEQPDVFGGNNIPSFYVDDEYTPDDYWVDIAGGQEGSDMSAENIRKAELLYMQFGGRKAA